jgi:protocatechuate 3,4-dioxygenase beta subunit
MNNDLQENERVTRRNVLGKLGSVIGLATLAACGHSFPGRGKSTAVSSSGNEACRVTPSGEIGPYFADDSARGFNRSNIVANIDGSEIQSGIPLELTLYIVDAENACKPMAGVQVDIWHCNAHGTYSDIEREHTETQSWLRGYQLSDSAGKLVFNTIIPGWYPGRATHIHLRIRSVYSDTASPFDSANTTQLFFSQPVVDLINTTVAPYKSKGANSTTNADDRVYTEQTNGQMLLSLSGNNINGYRSSTTISLPIAN